MAKITIPTQTYDAPSITLSKSVSVQFDPQSVTIPKQTIDMANNPVKLTGDDVKIV